MWAWIVGLAGLLSYSTCFNPDIGSGARVQGLERHARTWSSVPKNCRNRAARACAREHVRVRVCLCVCVCECAGVCAHAHMHAQSSCIELSLEAGKLPLGMAGIKTTPSDEPDWTPLAYTQLLPGACIRTHRH